jgi:hypothetical protein
MTKSQDLFNVMSELLHHQSVDDVMPVLITASARALVMDAEGDIKKLAISHLQFCTLLQEQINDMWEQDAAEARGATRQ